ncbi:MAG: hypothetical protein QNL05_04185 [Gammaproteobacteria bacterium]|nr:hypothetical protein [Gammaproteobacteria bacterium]
MFFRVWLFTLFVVITLAGCKLQITVPTGGSVTSSSGSNDCAEGKTCTIDVSDLFFDDTFTAKAKSGYEFVNWKKKQRSFCGAGAARFTPCRLFTSLWEGKPEFEKFLDQDDVFFLEPVFAPNGSGSGSGGGSGGLGSESAKICFNADEFTKGFRSDIRHRTVDEDGTVEFQRVSLTNGLSSFEGRSGVKITSDVNTSGGGGPTTTARLKFYIDVNGAQQSVTNFAVDADLLTPYSGKIITRHIPGVLSRFNLNKGQSFSQSYNTDVTQTVNGIDGTHSFQKDSKTTYLGTESVTVPAGIFKACKFSDQTTTTSVLGPISDNTTSWFGVGNGQLIKQTSDGVSSTLLSGKINGSPIK